LRERRTCYENYCQSDEQADCYPASVKSRAK
jgi:hypothetical protein